MPIVFESATKDACKARIALTGPSNGGKTYTALMMACELASAEGGIPAVIDTERGSASKYVGTNGWRFDRFNAQSFDPLLLTEALGVAAGKGYPVVVVDSWSHFWMGTGGMLEQVDRRTAASRSNNSYGTGWKEMAPIEQRMLDAILGYPGHVIVTLRVKVEYVVEKDDRGKSSPRKVGMKPVQRDQFEYEFDVVGDLDADNTLTISKTRIPGLHGQIIPKPGVDLAMTIRDWLADGEEVPGPLAFRAQALDPDATYQGMRDLHAKVAAVGLINAPVTDGDDNPTVLGKLIADRGVALKPKLVPDSPPRSSQTEAAPRSPVGDHAEALPTDNGQPPTSRNGDNSDQETPSPADVARAKLRQSAAENNWGLVKIADLFEAEHGVTLREATNAGVIEAFRAGLFARRDDELVVAAS